MFLPGKHPHTHQIFSKALKWFQCYTTKGITDSLRESISPLSKFTHPKLGQLITKTDGGGTPHHLGLAQHAGISQGNFTNTLEVLQPLPAILSVWSTVYSPSHLSSVTGNVGNSFPSEQCYCGEQLEEGVLHKTNTRQA